MALAALSCAVGCTLSGSLLAQPGRPARPDAEEWEPADNEALPSHHARTLAQAGAGLTLGAVLYWLMMDRNVADWDNPAPEERFNGRAWRLDNNSLAVNFIAHPLMGGATYSAARANHHGIPVAFGYTFLTSFVWEFVLEFKEKVSVNDMIVTPGTGLPLGEFFYKLGLYLDTARDPGTGVHAARWALGTAVALDRAFDDRPPPLVRQRDALGFTSRIWHDFRVSAVSAFVQSADRPEYVRGNINVWGRLVTLPGYLRDGEFGRFFYGAEISDFSAGFEVSEHGAGMMLSADTIIAGYHAQRLQGADGAAGHAGTVGISIAYDYLRSKANDYAAFRSAAELPEPALERHVPSRAEQFSAFHLPGLALDWHARAPKIELTVRGRAHPGFAGVGAPAFYDFTAANPEDKSKHILHRQGYFYGWGASGSLAGTLRVGPLHLGADVFYGRYWSQDGLDRHVERLTHDTAAAGNVLFYSGELGVRLPGLPCTIGLQYGARRWYSRVGGFERIGRIDHRALFASYAF